MSMAGRWIWLQPVCALFAPRLRPVYTLGHILNKDFDSTDNRNNRRGLPQWEACCTVGPSAQWIFHRIAQTQANTKASSFLSRPARYKSLFSHSRSFLREESSIVPTYGGHWQLFQSQTCVKPGDPFKDSLLLQSRIRVVGVARQLRLKVNWTNCISHLKNIRDKIRMGNIWFNYPCRILIL